MPALVQTAPIDVAVRSRIQIGLIPKPLLICTRKLPPSHPPPPASWVLLKGRGRKREEGEQVGSGGGHRADSQSERLESPQIQGRAASDPPGTLRERPRPHPRLLVSDFSD